MKDQIEHPKLKLITRRYVVGWRREDGTNSLSTWMGETDNYIAQVPVELFSGMWEKSPKCNYYKFTEKLSYEEKLNITKEVNGTLVIAFKGKYEK
jgi:hypothetical protein